MSVRSSKQPNRRNRSVGVKPQTSLPQSGVELETQPLPASQRPSSSELRGSLRLPAARVKESSLEFRHTHYQEELFQFMATVNRAENPFQIYESAVMTVCRCLQTQRASILLADDDQVMRFKYSVGLSEGYRQAVEGHSPWKVGQSDPEPVCFEDVRLAPLEEHLRLTIQKEGIHALAFIPITHERRVVGKFMVYYNAPHQFTPEELGLVYAIASPVSFAIARQRAIEALAEAKRQLEQHTRNLELVVAERTAKLRETIGELEGFSYSLSHDLRAPLRAMRSFSELLRARYADRLDEEGNSFLDRIISAAGRLDRLIQDVLAYTRVAMAPVQQQPLDAEKLIRQVLRDNPSFQEPFASIDIQSPLLPVLGHEAPLTQCFYNLLSNAVKFVPAGKTPSIRIWSEPVGSYVRLCFEDNGIGIPQEAQGRMFLMFQRFHRPEDYDGTGIGLAIVRKAVERMGGAVGVDSGVEGGSRFWVRLPAAPRPVATEPA